MINSVSSHRAEAVGSCCGTGSAEAEGNMKRGAAHHGVGAPTVRGLLAGKPAYGSGPTSANRQRGCRRLCSGGASLGLLVLPALTEDECASATATRDMAQWAPFVRSHESRQGASPRSSRWRYNMCCGPRCHAAERLGDCHANRLRHAEQSKRAVGGSMAFMNPRLVVGCRGADEGLAIATCIWRRRQPGNHDIVQERTPA